MGKQKLKHHFSRSLPAAIAFGVHYARFIESPRCCTSGAMQQMIDRKLRHVQTYRCYDLLAFVELGMSHRD